MKRFQCTNKACEVLWDIPYDRVNGVDDNECAECGAGDVEPYEAIACVDYCGCEECVEKAERLRDEADDRGDYEMERRRDLGR